MDEDIATAPDQLGSPPVPPPAGPSPRRFAPVLILVGILVAALLAESVLVFRTSRGDRARDDVLVTARRFVALLTTYNAATIAAQRRDVLALATGNFRGQFEQLISPSFIATLKERQADSRGTAVRIAVSQVRDDTATVIALVQVTTKNKDVKTPRVENNLLELSLVETSNGWKIDAVTILGTVTT